MAFIINIKKHRKNKKLTIEECAELSGISFRYLASIEYGEKVPSIHVLYKIAKVLSVKTGDLIEDN